MVPSCELLALLQMALVSVQTPAVLLLLVNSIIAYTFTFHEHFYVVLQAETLESSVYLRTGLLGLGSFDS